MAKTYNLYYTNIDSISYNKTLAILDFQWNESLTIKTLEHVLICPSDGIYGGVVDSNGSFIDGTALHEGIVCNHKKRLKASVVRHRSAIFLGTWLNVYGHCITDNIKRLWIFEKNDIMKEYGDADFIYCCNSKSISDTMNQVLCLLGIDYNSLIQVDEVTFYDKVYIPDSSIVYHNKIRYFSNEFVGIVNKLLTFSSGDSDVYYEKIYLSRHYISLKNKKDFGEKAIENVFRANGFEVICPEQLPFIRQVDLLQHCKSLACTEGSISHNSIFCKEGTQVIILRKANYINGYQIMINEMKQLEVTYIDANHSIPIMNPWNGPFFLWRTSAFNLFWGQNGEDCKWFSIIWYEYLFYYCTKVIRFFAASLYHFCKRFLY